MCRPIVLRTQFSGRMVRMSVMERMSIGVLMASFCCVLTGIAAAQQAAPATGRDQSEARENVPDQGNPGAPNRASQQQRERSTSEGVGDRELSNRPNSRSQVRIGRENQEVEQYLIGCLLAKNASEVELSQFAEKQAASPEVKEFAQLMIQDHQKMIQQLEQLAGTQGNKDILQIRITLDLPANLEPAKIRQPHVQEDNIGPLFASQLQSLPAGRRFADLVAAAPQNLHKHAPDHLVIVHHKYAIRSVHTSNPCAST